MHQLSRQSASKCVINAKNYWSLFCLRKCNWAKSLDLWFSVFNLLYLTWLTAHNDCQHILVLQKKTKKPNQKPPPPLHWVKLFQIFKKLDFCFMIHMFHIISVCPTEVERYYPTEFRRWTSIQKAVNLNLYCDAVSSFTPSHSRMGMRAHTHTGIHLVSSPAPIMPSCSNVLTLVGDICIQHTDPMFCSHVLQQN